MQASLAGPLALAALREEETDAAEVVLVAVVGEVGAGGVLSQGTELATGGDVADRVDDVHNVVSGQHALSV